MFKHELSPYCNFQKARNRKRCQFWYTILDDLIIPSPSCDKELNSENPRSDHTNWNHDDKTKHTCPQCDSISISTEELELHRESEHLQGNSFPWENSYFVFDKRDISHILLEFNTTLKNQMMMKVKMKIIAINVDCVVFTTYDTFDDHQDSYHRCNHFAVLTTTHSKRLNM